MMKSKTSHIRGAAANHQAPPAGLDGAFSVLILLLAVALQLTVYIYRMRKQSVGYRTEKGNDRGACSLQI